MRGQRRHAYPKVVVAALVAASALLASAGPAAAATVAARNAVEPSLVSRINQVRAAHGLRALRVSKALTSAASRHAASMGWRGYFRHEMRHKATWVSFGRWVGWYWPGPGYSSWSAGENLAWGAPNATPSQTVNWWMNSPEHRANLLGSWRSVGVGIVHVSVPAGYYRDYPEVTIVAAEFGRRSG